MIIGEFPSAICQTFLGELWESCVLLGGRIFVHVMKIECNLKNKKKVGEGCVGVGWGEWG